MRIDGLPWRVYLWICVKAVAFGALCGGVGGWAAEWVMVSLVGR